MNKVELKRKARLFRAALGYAGTSAEAWAKTQGVTAGHLSQVLSGKRESRKLMALVESFTKQQADKIRAA